MRTLFAREPARVIGGLAAIVVLIATQLLSQGLVTSDGGTNVLHFVIVVVPLAAAEIIRSFVSPATS